MVIFWPPELVDRDRQQNGAPITQKEAVYDLLSHLDAQRSVGQDKVNPGVMRELVKGLAKQLSIIFHQTWQTGELPKDQTLANVMPIHRQGWKVGLGNYRSVIMTLPSKVMESS